MLDLKVCDPAMGSGAFLVEACRAIGDRLLKAWAVHKEARPTIPPDEDEQLHARRLVAQRCLYGIDRNPRAVDLARLSLWLATLARDHEFTFLDHALKCGDSLVGLSAAQIAAMHWDETKPPTLVGSLVAAHLREAEKGRAAIRERAEWAPEAELRPQLRAVDAKLSVARLIGDGIVAAFFAADKPKKRIERLVELQKIVQSHLGSSSWSEAIAPLGASLACGEHPIRPIHWQIEFPEVFTRQNGGFDAIVGNPPFLGGKSISTNFGDGFSVWLEEIHPGGTRSADLVAHFFRRAFCSLRLGGVFGLIATNTIGQGDTRDTGLKTIIGGGGAIIRATRRLKWPGEAAVVVSVVHVVKGATKAPVLDDCRVHRISAYLLEGDLDQSPLRLTANDGKAFVGSYILGIGFTFDDAAAAKGEAENLATMRALVEKAPRNAERIFPYVGGEEVNTDPRQAHHRYVIDFFDRPLRRESLLKRWVDMSGAEKAQCRVSGIVPNDYPDEVAEDWPDLLDIVKRFVKPERDGQKRKAIRERWWQYADKRPGLYKAIAPLDRVLVVSQISAHHAFVILDNGSVFAHRLNVFAFESNSAFAVLQSSTHENWARVFGYTLEDRFGYSPADNFRNFPFPANFTTGPELEVAGKAYHTFRAKLMIDRNEGLTRTYNRFHARSEHAPDIARLRELHAEMDRAVLRAYCWHDLAKRAHPEFIEQEADEGKTPKTRLDWPAEFKDEVLARLLALNAERAAAEKAAGLSAHAGEGETDVEEEL